MYAVKNLLIPQDQRGVSTVEVGAKLLNLIDNPAAIAAAISFGRRVEEEEFSDALANAGPHLLIFPLIKTWSCQTTRTAAAKSRGSFQELMDSFWPLDSSLTFLVKWTINRISSIHSSGQVVVGWKRNVHKTQKT